MDISFELNGQMIRAKVEREGLMGDGENNTTPSRGIFLSLRGSSIERGDSILRSERVNHTWTESFPDVLFATHRETVSPKPFLQATYCLSFLIPILSHCQNQSWFPVTLILTHLISKSLKASCMSLKPFPPSLKVLNQCSPFPSSAFDRSV